MPLCAAMAVQRPILATLPIQAPACSLKHLRRYVTTMGARKHRKHQQCTTKGQRWQHCPQEEWASSSVTTLLHSTTNYQEKLRTLCTVLAAREMSLPGLLVVGMLVNKANDNRSLAERAFHSFMILSRKGVSLANSAIK